MREERFHQIKRKRSIQREAALFKENDFVVYGIVDGAKVESQVTIWYRRLDVDGRNIAGIRWSPCSRQIAMKCPVKQKLMY